MFSPFPCSGRHCAPPAQGRQTDPGWEAPGAPILAAKERSASAPGRTRHLQSRPPDGSACWGPSSNRREDAGCQVTGGYQLCSITRLVPRWAPIGTRREKRRGPSPCAAPRERRGYSQSQMFAVPASRGSGCRLELPGEELFLGRGSFCVCPDAIACHGEENRAPHFPFVNLKFN